MITATFKVNPESKAIAEFKIKGHAMYAPYGEDIVCSAVSALSISIVNSLYVYAVAGIELIEFDDGFMVKVVRYSDVTDQLLLKTLKDGLILIAEQYPEHLEVKTIQHDQVVI